MEESPFPYIFQLLGAARSFGFWPPSISEQAADGCTFVTLHHLDIDSSFHLSPTRTLGPSWKRPGQFPHFKIC